MLGKKRNSLYPARPLNHTTHLTGIGRMEPALGRRRSLHYRFLDVDAASPSAIHEFSQRFGVLGNTQNIGSLTNLKKSRVLRKVFLKR